jgi:hypothetical protein
MDEDDEDIGYGWVKYGEGVSGDLEYNEIMKLIENANLQNDEIRFLAYSPSFAAFEFPYKALAAIINLRSKHNGLLTGIDIISRNVHAPVNNTEIVPQTHEIYICIGSESYEHADINIPVGTDLSN